MKNAQTVLAVYDSFESADRAIRALVDDGFSRADIGLAANDARGDYARMNTVADASEDVSSGEGGSFGAVIGGITGAVVALTAIVIPGIGPVIAAGPLVALLGGATGAVVGGAAGAVTGGVAASLIHLGVPEADADYYGESVRRGNALVTVTVDNDEDAETASNVLRRYNPVDVKNRASKWREAGWSGYDANAQPYTEEDLIRERELHSGDALPEDEVVNRYYPNPRA